MAAEAEAAREARAKVIAAEGEKNGEANARSWQRFSKNMSQSSIGNGW